jgi:hypothetical protein
MRSTIIDWPRRDRQDTPEQMATAMWPLLQACAATTNSRS